MEENTISNGQRKKLHGISCTFTAGKYLCVSTCRGWGHIVSASLQAAQFVGFSFDYHKGHLPTVL